MKTLGGSKIDYIEVHKDGFGLDERGLARSLYTELGTNTFQVERVFKRLDKHHSSSADDVAEHYVNLLRHRASACTSAVARNRDLVRLLIRVLDEAWTTSQQHECIAFLKTLGDA